ncbi:GntR family transcriptional regulator [Streptomyces sp. NPDC056160]|uniref:GntR family transcriptional regulator n=1 Tax=Streptomyces sp. NPDC056160 TaxID=3345731 RepID=UPI0035D82288
MPDQLTRLRHTRGTLHRAIAQLDGTGEALDRDRERVWAVVEQWLPLAQQRMREAAGSNRDQDRWQGLIRAATRPDTATAPAAQPTLLTVCNGARGLLRALLEAEHPGLTAAEVADRLRRAIRARDYPPGGRLSRARIIAGMGDLPHDRIDLALQDLQDEGLVAIGASGKARVAGTVPDPTDRVAAWLRFLIQSGVYPPHSTLQPAKALAQSLATSAPIMNRALRSLADQKIVVRPSAQAAHIHPEPPLPLAEPPELGVAARQLHHRADDLTPTGTQVLDACDRARAWWITRQAPAPEAVACCSRLLTRAAAILISRHADTSDAHLLTLLRRTAVTALAAWPADSAERIWRTACLATCVRDIHRAVDAATPLRPAAVQRCYPSQPTVALTPTEQSIADLLVRGVPSPEIARRTALPYAEVRRHLESLRTKSGNRPGCGWAALVHSLLTAGQVDAPDAGRPAPNFTPEQMRLLRAHATYSKINDIAAAAGIVTSAVRPRTRELLSVAGVTDTTQLIAAAHSWKLPCVTEQPGTGPNTLPVSSGGHL